MPSHARRLAGCAGITSLIATVGACVAGQQGSSADPFDGPRGSEEPVLLTVENNDFRDARIIA